MMETIHCINKLCKEAGCVSPLTFLFIFPLAYHLANVFCRPARH